MRMRAYGSRAEEGASIDGGCLFLNDLYLSPRSTGKVWGRPKGLMVPDRNALPLTPKAVSGVMG